jgi:hypothetical protein
MNDFEIDELASAYLDDAVTDEERARVDADPALLSRVDELRRVRDAVHSSTIEPASADTRDAAIASAVAAAPLVDLGAERARRRVRIASIAAAAILLIGAAGLLLRSVSGDSSTKTSTAAAASSSSSSSSASAAEAAAGLPNSVTASRVPSAYPDRAALVAAVEASMSSGQPTSADGAPNNKATGPLAADSSATSRCAVAPPDNTASQILSDSATLAGALVQVDVFALNDGSRRLIVTSAGSCTLVFTQTL